MTYRELCEKACRMLDSDEISIGEFEQMTAPLDNEIEPKTGEWIDTGSGTECSECHEIMYGYDNYRNYCPHCGAKMEGYIYV
jgi:hypothetical protein